MCTEKHWAEILDLKNRIEEKAFAKKEYFYETGIDKAEEEKTAKRHSRTKKTSKLISVYMKIYREGGYTRKLLLENVKSLSETDILDEIIKSFLLEVAEFIWEFKQTLNSGKKKEALNKMRSDNLESTKLELAERGYSPKAVTDILPKLEKDLDKSIQKYIKTKDYKYFHQIQSKGHLRIKRENDVIEKIKSLYEGLHKKEDSPIKPLSEREIASNMAIIFVATDFWTDRKKNETEVKRTERYFDNIRKRFQSIDRSQT